jgi:hypothetical protein
MTPETDVFFTPTYAKVCTNKQGIVISLYLSNASRTNVEIQSDKIGRKITLQIKAKAKTAESTSLNQFVGLEDPSLPLIIKFCLQKDGNGKSLLTEEEAALLG